MEAVERNEAIFGHHRTLTFLARLGAWGQMAAVNVNVATGGHINRDIRGIPAAARDPTGLTEHRHHQTFCPTGATV